MSKENVCTESFKVKGTDLEDFTEFINGVLPKEAAVDCYIRSTADVNITVPSRKARVFSKIRESTLLL